MAARMKKGKFDFEDYLESMNQMKKQDFSIRTVLYNMLNKIMLKKYGVVVF